MKLSTQPQSMQYRLQEAISTTKLARSKAATGTATPETLAHIEQLCAATEISLKRALTEAVNQREAKEIATSLLTSSTANQTTS
jgi:hypothetical protein